MLKHKSWVWQYARREGDKAICNLCEEDHNNEFSCAGGSTGSISRHLRVFHNCMLTNTETQDELSSVKQNETAPNMDKSLESSDVLDSPLPSRKRPRLSKSQCSSRACDPAKTEKIHQALAKLIVVNQLPISFCSSDGFRQFMNVVEPNYKACKEEALMSRLMLFKATIMKKITDKFNTVTNIVCTTDCWSSLSQDSYITITAHIINTNWEREAYILTTHEMEERHTAQNIADELKYTFRDWNITEKVDAIVTDNAKNMTNAVSLISTDSSISSVTCAAHTLQLAINNALKEETIQQLLHQCSKVVGHFKHSNVAKQALEQKQQQLSMSQTSLLQSCSTRWNSTYFMLDRLYINRCPISNVIADRSITTATAAQHLEISENQWTMIESLLNILRPLQVLTTVFCGESHSPLAMVRPLIKKIMEKHIKFDECDQPTFHTLKEILRSELIKRFKLAGDGSEITQDHIACFFDPRYKDLDHEALNVREMLRRKIKCLLEDAPVQTPTMKKPEQKSGLEFLYDEITDIDNVNVEFETYLAEPQLRFDLDPFEWWKARTSKYPRICKLAKKYLTIPATSVMSERCFSSAGNIVTPKRNRLLPENVNLLVFLYQNRRLLN